MKTLRVSYVPGQRKRALSFVRDVRKTARGLGASRIIVAQTKQMGPLDWHIEVSIK